VVGYRASGIYNNKRSWSPIEDGTEIKKITRDGRQTLYAVFEEVKFTVLK